MKKLLLLLVSIIFISGLSYAQQNTLFFASYPALSPDGNTLIFSYKNDLWRSDTKGGLSTRITAMEGSAERARISPDGKWVAFSNSQFGNNDIYIMPVNGGDIKRLTFHSADDLVESWSWNNNFIYFTSNRFNRMSTYKVNINGGTPVRVFSADYFDYTHNAFEHPLTGEIFFDDTWESANFYNRIGYEGPFNPEIQSYNPKNKEYKRYTNWEGKDMSISLDKKGNMYFISDEANGKYNLYTFKNSKKIPLTHFNTSMFRPYVNANGGKVVFEKDFQLYIYDVASKKSSLIPLRTYTINTLSAKQDYNVNGHISNFALSGDGDKLAFVSRGKLFVSDNKGKFIKEITTSPAERVVEVFWLKDNETLLYGQTYKGFENFFTQNLTKNEEAKQITNNQRNNRSLTFNSDKTKAVYLSGNNEIQLLDLKSMESTLLAKDEIWGTVKSNPYFSPDDKYIMYNAHHNFEQDIFLYRLADKQLFNITNTGVSEVDPFWSPDGKYIYFTSDRIHPTYPYGMQESKIYRMALQRIEEPYTSDKFDSLFVKGPKDEDKKKDVKKDSTTNKKKEDNETKRSSAQKKPVVKIDFRDMMDRLEQVGPSFGKQRGVFVAQEKEKTYVIFSSNHEDGKWGTWQVVYEPFEKTKTERIKGADGGVDIKGYKNHYYVLNRGDIKKLNLNSKSTDKIDMNYTFTKNMKDEFNQMFYEAWGVLQENYYNLNFNGVDWKAIRKQYASYLPYVQTRSDIRVLLNNMMGELNSSHYGFSTSGSDEKTFYRTSTASDGIMFDNNHPYVVDYVVKDGCADFYEIKIRKGDVLVEVDGERVDESRSREFYFMKSSIPDEMTLRFRRGQNEFDVKIHPTVYNRMSSHLYDSWVDHNRQLVNKLGKGQIGYVYMKNMTGGSLEEFYLDMVSDSVSNKKALIFDLRYNTGGNVHDKVLQFLAQRPYLQWKYRNGKLSPQPSFAPSAKPIILLMNEQTLSDGEMTAAGFKELNLGTIIGTPTYRWIIFTSAARLVDGSSVRLPSWGCYTLDGGNLERTGVTPDIFVKNTFEDRMKNKDPQIERAVEEILKKLK